MYCKLYINTELFDGVPLNKYIIYVTGSEKRAHLA